MKQGCIHLICLQNRITLLSLEIYLQVGQPHEHAGRAMTQDPCSLRRVQCFVYALGVLKFLIFEQGACLHFHFVLDPANYGVDPACRLTPANISVTGLWTVPFLISHHDHMRNPAGRAGIVVCSVEPWAEKATFFILNRPAMNDAAHLSWVGLCLLINFLELQSS